jgi:hypothetical protein
MLLVDLAKRVEAKHANLVYDQYFPAPPPHAGTVVYNMMIFIFEGSLSLINLYTYNMKTCTGAISIILLI